MKKCFFLLLLFGYTVVLKAQNSDQEPYLTKSLSKENIRTVNLETTGGNISVTSASGNDTRLEVFVQPNNSRNNSLSKEEIKKRLEEDYDLDISVSGNKLTAIAKQKHRNMDWRRSLNVSFKAFVPEKVSTDLSTSGGNISLKNVSGTQDFSTSGGNLSVDNVSGKIIGKTSGGNVRVYNCKDDIDLSTSGGNINADNSTGNILLSTSGGSLRLNNLSGTIKAETSGGNVHGESVMGELVTNTSGGNISLSDLSCSLETSTSGGHIDVAIKEFGKYTKISNSGGNITLQIPKNKGLDIRLSANKITTGELENFKGKIEDDDINGSINGGGVPLNVTAGSGNIHLSFR